MVYRNVREDLVFYIDDEHVMVKNDLREELVFDSILLYSLIASKLDEGIDLENIYDKLEIVGRDRNSINENIELLLQKGYIEKIWV